MVESRHSEIKAKFRIITDSLIQILAMISILRKCIQYYNMYSWHHVGRWLEYARPSALAVAPKGRVTPRELIHIKRTSSLVLWAFCLVIQLIDDIWEDPLRGISCVLRAQNWAPKWGTRNGSFGVVQLMSFSWSRPWYNSIGATKSNVNEGFR